jgi:acyl-CoA thioester hydrolase
LRIHVMPEHLDALNHVNNVVYLQWMQDAAEQHWNKFVPTHLANEIVWVAKQHTINYHAPAFLHEELEMRTHTGNYSAASWDRHYTLGRVADDKIIITAKSVWVLLDKQTMRPRRIDETILAVLR